MFALLCTEKLCRAIS